MNVDIKKFKLKNEVNKTVDDSMLNDYTMIDIPEEKIYMEFIINNQNYIVFTENSKETEEMEMMFAKVEFKDGNKILRNIGTTEEYESVIIEFNKRLEMMSII